MTTLSELQNMTDVEAYFFAKKMVTICFDREKLIKLAGDKDDLIHLIGEQIFHFKEGRETLVGDSVERACFGIVRGNLRANWMRAAFADPDSSPEIKDEIACEDEEEPIFEHTLDDIEWLTPMDKLLIQHDSLKAGSSQSQTKDLAEFFGCTTRTIRLKKEALKKKLIAEFNLEPDFFDKKSEFAF